MSRLRSVAATAALSLATSLLLLGWGTSAARAASAAGCVDIPRDAADAPVHVCEHADAYEFAVPGWTGRFGKAEYRARFARLAATWLATTSSRPEWWRRARVEAWLAVPDSAPEATALRMVVTGAAGGVVAYLPLDPRRWRIEDANVGVLSAGRSYPADFGFRAGALLVAAAAGVSRTELARFVARVPGLALGGDAGGGWFGITTPPLAERESAMRLTGEPDAAELVRGVEMNSLIEWIATREPAFHFQLTLPE